VTLFLSAVGLLPDLLTGPTHDTVPALLYIFYSKLSVAAPTSPSSAALTA
jgi:hypothetical protein